MIQVNLDFANDQFREVLQQEIQKAVTEVVAKEQYPPLLTRKDLEEIFQVESTAINKLVNMKSFPKFEMIRARYPRDQVMEWIKQNSSWVESNSKHLNKVI